MKTARYKRCLERTLRLLPKHLRESVTLEKREIILDNPDYPKGVYDRFSPITAMNKPPPGVSAYRVGKMPDGKFGWWETWEYLDTFHTEVRDATPRESYLMDKALAGTLTYMEGVELVKLMNTKEQKT